MPPPSVHHFSSLERVALQKTNYMYTSPSPVLKQLYITAKWTRTIYLSIILYICRPPIHTNFNLVVHCSSVPCTPSLFFFFFFLFTAYKSQSACSFQSAKRIWSNACNIFNKITLYVYIYIQSYIHMFWMYIVQGIQPPLRSRVSHMVNFKSLLPTLFKRTLFLCV